MSRIKPYRDDDVLILVERTQAGDREAFREIVRLYQQRVFVLAYSFFKNREDALDIVQDTFLRLHEKIGLYERGRNFQGWLLQIAKNLCVDYYRKNYRKRKEFESEKSLDELSPAAPSDPAGQDAIDLKTPFSRCVERLAERQRMIIILKHYNELPYNEIAQVLNISIGTVKSLHFKAVQNLRKLLTPYLGVQG